MSLWRDLPAPSNEPPAKRPRTEPDAEGSKQRDGAEAAAGAREAAPSHPAPGGGEPEDQVKSALTRLASHIGKKDKMRKAGSLVRKLFGSGELGREHGKLCFKVLEEAMRDESSANDPSLRGDYRALFMAADSIADQVFSRPQKQQLEVWCLRACKMNEMNTDDNFSFTKRISEVKGLIAALPEWTEEEEKARVLPEPPQAPPPPAAAPAEEEDDPFGLNALAPTVSADEEKAQAAHGAAMAAYAEAKAEARASKLMADRRSALLGCVEEAHRQYATAGKQWTQTTLDMFIQAVYEQQGRFSPGDRRSLFKMYEHVKEAQTARRQKAQREANRDRTSFERSQEKYRGMDISIRAAVGSEGNVDGRGESCATDLGDMGRQT